MQPWASSKGTQFGILLENLDLMINLRGTVMMGHLLMLVMLPMVRQMKNESLERQLYLTLPELYPQPGKTVLLIRRFGILSVPGHRRAPSPCRAYPELFAVVGGQVPDLRGLFLRGHGGSSAALGVQQGDAIRNIKGQITGNGLMSGGATGPFYSWYTQNFGIGNGAYDKNGVAFDVSRVVPTAEENRPVNQAVRYLVRARP